MFYDDDIRVGLDGLTHAERLDEWFGPVTTAWDERDLDTDDEEEEE